jgi:hypothetical protein
LLECFEQWVNTIRVEEEREQIAFDGKVIRGSGNGSSLNPLQLMSAIVVNSGLILYQQEVSDKTNEIPLICHPALNLQIRYRSLIEQYWRNLSVQMCFFKNNLTAIFDLDLLCQSD